MGCVLIYIKVSIKRKSTKLPANMQADETEWNTKLGCFKEARSSVRNSVLKKKVSKIEDFLWTQIAADNELTHHDYNAILSYLKLQALN